jgi:hypothetical protein
MRFQRPRLRLGGIQREPIPLGRPPVWNLKPRHQPPPAGGNGPVLTFMIIRLAHRSDKPNQRNAKPSQTDVQQATHIRAQTRAIAHIPTT